MVAAVNHKVPQARPANANVSICKDLVRVLLLVSNKLVALATTHLHLLLVARLVHQALTVAPELAVARLETRGPQLFLL